MPTWETTSDWDSAKSEFGVRHPSGTMEKGFPRSASEWDDWSVPAPDSFWSMTGSSGPATDHIGGYDLTLNGATLGASGVLANTALSRDGTDDLPKNTSYPDITAGNPQSLFFWIKTTDTNDGQSDFGADLMSHTGDNGDGWGMLLDQSGSVTVFTSGNNIRGKTGPAINDGVYHSVLFVFDQANDTVRFDIDGTTEIEVTSYTDDSGTSNGVFRLQSPSDDNLVDYDLCQLAYWRNHAVSKTNSTNLYETFV